MHTHTHTHTRTQGALIDVEQCHTSELLRADPQDGLDVEKQHSACLADLKQLHQMPATMQLMRTGSLFGTVYITDASRYNMQMVGGLHALPVTAFRHKVFALLICWLFSSCLEHRPVNVFCVISFCDIHVVKSSTV